VLSTTTPTGQAIAQGAGADAVFYMPLDMPHAVRAYVEALQPRALLLVETEIWPNLLRACRDSRRSRREVMRGCVVYGQHR